MYRDYFGIEEKPFSITPDPRYLLLTQGHQEALAHLLYGIYEGGGFVLLTGEVGTGKTSLCRRLAQQVDEAVHCALVLNPHLTALDAVAIICDELGVFYPAVTDNLKDLTDLLNKHLLALHARGERAVVLIDEAQNLSPSVLEELRLLTNLETDKHKLLQIILVGQPELNDLLQRRDLRQVAQRITARYHLMPLKRAETRAYVAHRLRVAGLPPSLFTHGAVSLVHKRAGGVPRLINLICDRAMLGAYVRERKVVGRALVRRAAAEVFGPGGPPPLSARKSRRGPVMAFAALAMLLLAALGFVAGPSIVDRLRQDRKWVVALPALDAAPDKTAPDKTAPGGDGLAATTSGGEQSPQSGPAVATARQPAQEAGVADRPVSERTAAIAVLGGPDSSATDSGATENADQRPRDPAVAPATAADRGGERLATLPPPDPLGAEVAVPEIAVPEFAVPEFAVPEVAVPEVAVPEVAVPEVAASEIEPSTSPADPIGPSLTDLLRVATVGGSREAALGRLFALWGRGDAPTAEAEACDPARNGGHSCLQEDDGWRGIETFGRPVLITLRGPDGAARSATLLALDGDRVALEIAGSALTVQRAELASLWDGDYLLIWRAPETWERMLVQGSNGADVLWLRQVLAAVLERPVEPADSPYFDAALKEAVAAFQRSRGLAPDGIVGSKTIIMLNNALGGDAIPRLDGG